MPTISFVGAGSTVFARQLMSDCLSYPELRDATYVLFDIDAERLRVSEQMAQHLAGAWEAKPRIVTTTDAHEAFAGSDYAVLMLQVGGYKPCTVTDFEIPKRYGLRQTIGDTLGIGGIMRALRTVPVLLDYAAIMAEVCPEVTVLNYVNPLAMTTWALDAATDLNVVGLCHSVQGSYRHLVEAVGANADRVRYTCAGINHMAFYLTLTEDGEDLYPRIFDAVRSGAYLPEWDRVRLDMLLRIGYYITESSEHFAEYVPWYIKDAAPERIARYGIPLDEYPRRCEAQIAGWERMAADLAAGVGFEHPARSTEYGGRIIHALESGEPTVVHGNVSNDGLIDNLPAGCCVEVPCLVDGNGIQPVKVGELPLICAALNRTCINVQELTVAAALTGDRSYIYQAALMDPHTGAVLDTEQITHLVDDLLEAHGEWIPEAHERGEGCGCGCA